MNLTDDNRELIAKAREIGPKLRASSGDRERLAGWVIAELVALAEKLAELTDLAGRPTPGMPAVTVLDSQLAQAAKLAETMTASPELPEPWTVQDVIGVALSRGLLDLEQTYVKDDGKHEVSQ